MSRSLPVPPGQESRIVIHFHDEQEAYFADDLDPARMSGTIEVREE